jgi:hypothetical protein
LSLLRSWDNLHAAFAFSIKLTSNTFNFTGAPEATIVSFLVNLQFDYSAKALARERAAMTKQSDCHQ